MQMFSQFIINEKIILQAVPVNSEGDQNLWEMRVEYKIPVHIHTLLVAIMRHSKTQGTRLLGSIKLERGQLLASMKQKSSGFSLGLVKVNNDGPSLEFSARFSISKSPTMSSKHPHEAHVAGNDTNSLNSRLITTRLMQMYRNQIPIDSLELLTMHEGILLLSNQPEDRVQLLYMVGRIFLRQYRTSQVMDDLNQAVCAHNDAVREGPLGNESLGPLGIVLLNRFEQVGDIGDLKKAVFMLEAAVEISPDGDPNKFTRLNNLGIALGYQFNNLGELNDLNKSVMVYERAVKLIPDAHQEKLAFLSNLGSSLASRFERLGNLEDLKRSVVIFEEVVGLTPDNHPNKALWLGNLANSVLTRFDWLGDLGDLKLSVLMFQESVRLTPDDHTKKASRLNNLGSSLHTQFERLGDLDDVNKSVQLLEQALRLTTVGHPERPLVTGNLGRFLLSRFKRLGNISDLTQSVLRFEESVRLTPGGHQDEPLRLNGLGDSLLSRFQQVGNITDIERAVQIFDKAVELTPDSHPEKSSRLNSLGISLCHRFDRLCGPIDINKAVSIFQHSIELTPDDHPDKISRLNHRARSLLIRFVLSGNLGDLNDSVMMFEEGARFIPVDHPEKPSAIDSLGSALLRRFQQIGDLGDLNRSVLMYEEGVKLTPDDHPAKVGRLSNLGVSLRHRFSRVKNLDDINKSVLLLEEVLSLTSDGHPERSSAFTNLGNSLLRRFESLGHIQDLDRSVLMLKEAVQLSPDDHPGKPSLLNNLGNSLSVRFAKIGALDDINNSVLMQKSAVGLTPDGHPSKPRWMVNLGNSLFRRFERLQEPDDFYEMIVQYSSAAGSTTGPASVRFYGAMKWAEHAQNSQHTSLLDAYSAALGLLHELAWLGLSITDRHHQILQAGAVVRGAAAAAIAASQPSMAVEWLEQGRAIIWGQLLSLRTPVDALKKKHPKHAEDLIFLSTQLEGAGTQLSALEAATAAKQPSLQNTAEQYHLYADKRESLLKEIRTFEGFDRFLLPKPISELSLAAYQGPVIILNASEVRCDALVIMPGLDEIMHVQLPDFTFHDAQSLAKSLQYLISPSGRSDRLFGRVEGHIVPEEKFALILSQLWVKVVKPVLDGIAMTTPSKDNPPRVWWCLTGPLTFLPIHAAGLYGKDEAFGSKLSDFAISSYTPSLNALIQGFRPGSQSQKRFQLLAVAQPSAAGQSYIPGTQDEINHIQRLASGKLPILRLEEDMATIESVQHGMKESSWVHFACHGVQNASNPTESALLLAGHSRLTLSSIIKLFLPHADFAFLSACQTATGDSDLQEESVHLAAGMLLAGYRGVIATMWSIMDNDAPQVANDVYEHIFKTSPADPTHAAEALHHAVRKLREASNGRKSFFHWVPFIHVGV
ncbi:TPR-like protein [Mycena pura]|uniref:TPR-like protein n=1 Tax=Mycena pura TaxID=153505 RepID=A0AAD6UNR8_9AGAR|nr:TPR-like protein [Mycena pura]